LAAPTVLVTGASGFIGRHLVAKLREDAVRLLTPRVELGPHADWRGALEGADCVIHLAAAAHERAQVHERARDYGALQRVNALGSERLAREAAAAGAKRFIFLSTIGVHGDETRGAPFTEASAFAPRSLYAASKLEAEERLGAVARETGLQLAVLRPTLVYGPGNGGNFLRLLQAVKSGWPLPLGAIRNRRSLTYVGNLVSAIAALLARPDLAGAFVVCDAEALSTAQIVRGVAEGLGRRARLFALPEVLLRLAGGATGRGELVRRLTGSLEAESGALRRRAGWQAPFPAPQALALTGAWFAKG
jgi:nucleoside-diphosphate-sugar epimerase